VTQLDPANINPVAVEKEIVRFVGLLESATTKVYRRGRARAQAKVAYEVAHAEALLKAEGTVDEKKAQAYLAAQKEASTLETTEAVLHAAIEASRNIREQLGALRSVMANTRSLLEHNRD
jgi:hypothetical protein